MIKRTAIAILLLLTTTPLFCAPVFQEVYFTYAGNFKGRLLIPDKPGKLPVIIYNYDQYLDWTGEKQARVQGYDINRTMEYLANQGFIVFIPIERFRKMNAIKGAIQYIASHPKTDRSQIHLIGLSEGGFLSLQAAKEIPYIKTVSVITPRPLGDTGYFSLPGMLRELGQIRIPIMYIVGTDERTWTQERARILAIAIYQHHLNMTYREYPYGKKWFWSEQHQFMTDIITFIRQHM